MKFRCNIFFQKCYFISEYDIICNNVNVTEEYCENSCSISRQFYVCQ